MARQYYKDSTTGQMKPLGVKVEDTLPVGTEVDYDGQDIPEGWVEVDDPNEYSTNEQVIGKWIDGKPLYRKVFSITNPQASNTNYYDVSNLNIDTLVDLKAPITNSQIGHFVAPFQDSTDNFAILFINTANYLRGRFGTYIINGFISCEVIILYTKTTD